MSLTLIKIVSNCHYRGVKRAYRMTITLNFSTTDAYSSLSDNSHALTFLNFVLVWNKNHFINAKPSELDVAYY